jgi:hypothetical protein
MSTLVKRDRGLHHSVQLLAWILLSAVRVEAANIPESTSKLARAHEITRSYVIPLGLRGKSAANALGVLLAEGFRCDLKSRREVGTFDNPLSDCIKKPTGFGPLCEDLIVSAYFETQEKILLPAELLGRLNDIKVHAGLSFCPYRNSPKAEYVTHQNVGSDTLTELVRSRDLVGDAQAAYAKLMLDGYYCGFELDPATGKPVGHPKLICTQWPTKIKYCYEAKVVMDVRWSASANEAIKLLSELKAAQILRVQSSCEVPAAKRATTALPGTGLAI